MFRIFRWIRYKLRERREKVYWFDGVVWEHRPVDIQTAGLVGQVIYGLVEKVDSKTPPESPPAIAVGEDDSKTPPESPPAIADGGEKEEMTLGRLLSEVMDAEAMAKIVSILLVNVTPPESPPTLQGGSEGWRRFLLFPSEDAWEIVTDFFTWNKNSAMSIALSAAAMIGTKGSNGRVRIRDRDSASSH